MSGTQPKVRKVIRVEYEDGRVETFNPNRPRLLIVFEREFGVQQPQSHEQLAWLAWHALGRQGDFEAWIDTVETIDTAEVPVGKETS